MTGLKTIQSLIEELLRLAPWWQGWPQAIRAEALDAFERTHGVTLPAEHRALLETVGDRAPLPNHPDGALAPLDQARQVTTASAFLGPLALPFPHAGLEPLELAWDDDADDFADPAWLPGCLPLAGAGCDLSVVLVVSGPQRGRVWTVTPSAAPELHPSGLGFGDWYAGELERSLVPLRERAAREAALERQTRADPSDLDAVVELSEALLCRAPARAAAVLDRFAASSPEPQDLRFARVRAQLDLIGGRLERLTSLREHADPALRCYAAIAAIRADQHRAGLDALADLTAPASIQKLVREHLAIARWREGDRDQAIQTLRQSPPDRRRVELEAAMLDASGRAAEANAAPARLGSLAKPRRPRAPTLFDHLPTLELGR